MTMPLRAHTNGEKAIAWIERFCLAHGRPVKLSPEERVTLYRVYDGGLLEPIDGRLGAYLVLYHLVGYGAVDESQPTPPCRADIFSVWNSCGDELRRVLRRHGDALTCDELQRSWRAAA